MHRFRITHLCRIVACVLLLCICLAIGARNAKPEPFDAMNYHPYAAPYVPIIIRVLIDQNMITRGEDLKLILLFKKHNFSGKKYIEDNYSVFDQPTSITCDIECYSYTHSKEKRTVWTKRYDDFSKKTLSKFYEKPPLMWHRCDISNKLKEEITITRDMLTDDAYRIVFSVCIEVFIPVPYYPQPIEYSSTKSIYYDRYENDTIRLFEDYDDYRDRD